MKALATLAVLLAFAGCGGETSEAEPEDATDDTTEPAEASRCLPVGSSLKKSIASGLTVQGGGELGEAAAVKSSVVDGLGEDPNEPVYFVSALIRGPGMGSDTVGTWGTNIPPDTKDAGGLIIASDAIAREFSKWGVLDSDDTAPVADGPFAMSNDGAQESRDCLED